MKDVILILAVLALIAGVSIAAEIYDARSDCTTFEPANIIDKDQLKSVWGNADGLGGAALDDIEDDDGDYYDRPNLSGLDWVWIMVRFDCSDTSGHTIDWEGVTDAYESYGMEVYAWNPEEENFDYMDEGPNTWWTTHREFGLRGSYFVYDDDVGAYVALILIQGRTVPYKRAMYIDMGNVE